MNTGNRILAAGFALAMVLGVFAGAIAGTAAAVPVAAPILTIDNPTNNTTTNEAFMNVTWTVTGVTADYWNYTRTYLVGTTPGDYINVSDADYYNFTAEANGDYVTDVFVAYWNGTGYENSTVESVYFTVEAFPEIDISYPVAGGVYKTTYIDAQWNVTSVNGIQKTEVKMDSENFTDVEWNSSYNFTALATGAHTLTVQVTDNATHVVNESLSFTIDLVAPTVSSFQPSGVAVPLRTSMVITFSEEMDQESVGVALTPTPATFGDPVWTNGNKTATYFVEFVSSTNYSAVVTGKDLAGNAMTPATYTFSSLTLVTGRVVDANGNALANANITLTSTLAGGGVYYTNSDDLGDISVLVPAGPYNIKVTMSGYDDLTKSVTVGPGQTANNLGDLSMTTAMDWTLAIVIIIIGIIVIVAIVAVMRMRK